MNKSLSFKVRSQKGIILKHMRENPNTWYLSSEFCGGNPQCPYIGYEAPTRICELAKLGVLISQWSNRESRRKEYKLNLGKIVSSFDGDLIKITPTSPPRLPIDLDPK